MPLSVHRSTFVSIDRITRSTENNAMRTYSRCSPTVNDCTSFTIMNNSKIASVTNIFTDVLKIKLEVIDGGEFRECIKNNEKKGVNFFNKICRNIFFQHFTRMLP